MGIPGILKEIGKGERVALSKLAIEHLERTNRPIRIAIDAAIWNFQNQAGQGGKNPALRTLFFRLLKLLALPIHPVFVYDGKNKPLTKRGKTVSRYGTCVENETAKHLLSAFRFPHHTAPGEAEAECAFLQKKGVVDAVMSQDVDAIMFGSTLTLRDWSKEGTKGNKTPTHVNVLDLPGIKRISGLDPDGMILVALLSGGDYDENGVPGFGSSLACEIARAGFGSDLLELIHANDQDGLKDWRDRLEYELQTNESGYFRTRHLKLRLPEDFPDADILGYYTEPAVSKQEDLPVLANRWSKEWKAELDVPALRQYTITNFDWTWKSGAHSFVRRIGQPLFQNRLLRATIAPDSFSMDHITELRRHFTNDGIEELRLTVVPAEIVNIDIEAEADDPENANGETNEDICEEEVEGAVDPSDERGSAPPASPAKKRKQPWSPYDKEKWWLPQTLLQLGLPVIVEEWQQKQRDIQADPKKFASRKCSKVPKATRTVDASMKTGALREFLAAKPGTDRLPHMHYNMSAARVPRTPTKTSRHVSIDDESPSITRFFQASKAANSLRDAFTKTTDPRPIEIASSPSDTRSSLEADHYHARPAPSDYRASKRSTNSNDTIRTNLRHRHKPDKEASTNTRTSPELSNDDNTSSLCAGAPYDELQLPHVTQRKKKQRRPSRNKSSADSPTRAEQEPKLASVLSRPEQGTGYGVVPIQSGLPCGHGQVHPTSSSIGAKSQFSLSQITVASRESLPGAWRTAEADSVRNKRGPRVSYIDLTAD